MICQGDDLGKKATINEEWTSKKLKRAQNDEAKRREREIWSIHTILLPLSSRIWWYSSLDFFLSWRQLRESIKDHPFSTISARVCVSPDSVMLMTCFLPVQLSFAFSILVSLKCNQCQQTVGFRSSHECHKMMKKWMVNVNSGKTASHEFDYNRNKSLDLGTILISR